MSVPLSILYLLIINLMEFLKVWAKHNFHYIRYISVYIQPRYFYLIFRSVTCNNMNRVILHSVRPSFWKKRAFSHAPRCGSTESGCEISVPWWLILADLGKMTSVWSRDRDTGDTSEVQGTRGHTSCIRDVHVNVLISVIYPCRIIINASNSTCPRRRAQGVTSKLYFDQAPAWRAQLVTRNEIKTAILNASAGCRAYEFGTPGR